MRGETRAFGVVLALLLIFGPVFASGDFFVSNVATIPGTAHPGDVVYVVATVSNSESSTIDDVRATLEPLNGESNLEIWSINNRAEHIPPYGSVTLSFAVKIPSKAKEKYLLELRVYSGYDYITRTIPIFVSAPRDLLIKITTARIDAGSCSKIPVTLENISKLDIVHVTASASSAPPVYVRGDVDLNEIPAGTSRQVVLTVCADRDTVSGIYPVNLTVAYETGAGKGIAVRQIPIYVKNEPNVVVAGASTNPPEVKEGQEYDIQVVLQNMSIEPAYGVKLSVDRNACDPETSTAEIADSPLYRGMYARISVHCRKKARAGEVSIPVTVTYFDRTGNLYSREANVEIRVEPFPKLDIVKYYAENMFTSQTGKIVITLRNNGSEAAKNISVFADPEWPFYTDQKRDYIDEIAPGEEKNAIIYMSVYPNAKSKHYGLEIRLKYKGREDDSYVSDEETLSIPVKQTDIVNYAAYWIASNWLFSVLAAALIGGLAYLAARAERE